MSESSKIPPGPGGSRFLNTMRVLRNPQKAFLDWSQRYGDPFLVRALNGPIVVTGQPELIKKIYSHDAKDFDAFGKRAVIPMLGEGSMLMLDGNTHRQERKLTMPMFHGERMRAYADIIRDSTLQEMQGHTSGAPFEMMSVTTEISLQVIVQAVLGGEQAETIDQLMNLAKETIRRSLPILFFSPRLQFSFFGISPWDQCQRARRRLRDAFDQELKRRETDPKEREDILELLLKARYEDGQAMEKQHLFDELGTFLFAGHETSAVAMAWATYYLLSNPDKLSKLKTELDSCDASSGAELAKLPYLKAVVSESLRLNPIVTEVVRLLNKPIQFEGYDLPAGFSLAPATVMVHYNEEIFPEPEKFRPERFLENNFSAWQYMPFGGGARRCIGAAFSLYEMAIALGTVFANYELELLESKPVVAQRRNVTMGPSTGIRVRVSKAS
ncbi:MAG: cytochrome P450 [Planctomycetota bacterium]